MAETVKRSLTLLVAAVSAFVAACGKVADEGDVDTTASTSAESTASTSVGTALEAGAYVLDFTSSEVGGVWVGGNTNLAFSLSSATPRALAFQGPGIALEQVGGAILSNDFTRCSGPDQLETHVKDLPVDMTANVGTLAIDVEAGGGQVDLRNGFCYGTRKQGVWSWKLEPQVWTHNAATHTYHVDLVLDEEGIDAIKIASTAQKRPVTTITYSVF